MSKVTRGSRVIFIKDDNGSWGSQTSKGTVGYCFWTGPGDRPGRERAGVIIRGSNKKVFVEVEVIEVLLPKNVTLKVAQLPLFA